MFNVIDCIGRSIALAELGSATDQMALDCNRTVAFDRHLPAALERATKILHRQNIVFVETIVVGQRSTLCDRAEECPLSGAKRTSRFQGEMSAFDPKRTSSFWPSREFKRDHVCEYWARKLLNVMAVTENPWPVLASNALESESQNTD